MSASSRSPRRGSPGRHGAVDRALLVIAGSVVVMVLLVVALLRNKPGVQPAPGQPNAGTKSNGLVIYCAASNKSVIEAIRADYEREYKIPVDVNYGASQTLLAAQ